MVIGQKQLVHATTRCCYTAKPVACLIATLSTLTSHGWFIYMDGSYTWMVHIHGHQIDAQTCLSDIHAKLEVCTLQLLLSTINNPTVQAFCSYIVYLRVQGTAAINPLRGNCRKREVDPTIVVDETPLPKRKRV